MKHGHFQASSFYDEKDEYPEMSEEKWQWFIIIQSFSIVQDPSPQLTLAEITHIKKHWFLGNPCLQGLKYDPQINP